MKRILVLVMVILSVLSIVAAAAASGFLSAAPNSGDGVSDGSGFDFESGSNIDDAGNATGPALNSGDGVPDGSGF